jgi:hypothetical protein
VQALWRNSCSRHRSPQTRCCTPQQEQRGNKHNKEQTQVEDTKTNASSMLVTPHKPHTCRAAMDGALYLCRWDRVSSGVKRDWAERTSTCAHKWRYTIHSPWARKHPVVAGGAVTLRQMMTSCFTCS